MFAVFSVSRRRYNVGKRQKLKSLQRQYIYHTTENAKIKKVIITLQHIAKLSV